MEHLEFLNLSATSVKELPPSIENLVALRKLDLSRCMNLEVVSDYLFRLTSLQELNLSWTEIKSLPASIKQAAQLSRLDLSFCCSLESLPELPPLLQNLEVNWCTSLKTVSSSSTAITQGWEEYIFSRGLHEKHIFYECPMLDENARSNIMGDAQLRIMRMAIASSKFKEDKIEEAYDLYNSYYSTNTDSANQSDKEFFVKRSLVAIRCCGYEIPKWFSHKSEGRSIKIELPRDWFSTDFLGFALSIKIELPHWFHTNWWDFTTSFGFTPTEDYMKVGCNYNFKTSNGESHEVNHLLNYPIPIAGLKDGDQQEVFVWWYNNVFEEVVKRAESPAAFCKLVTEVNVDFTIWSHYDLFKGKVLEVKKCGICLLYGKDAEMIKQRALYAQDF